MALIKCHDCGKDLSTAAVQCPHCGAPSRVSRAKKRGCLPWLLGIAGLLFVLVSVSPPPPPASNSGADTESAASRDPKADAIAATALEFEWSKGGFGNVMEANFTITNNSPQDLKDFEITCTHFAKSGTEIDSNTRTVYDVVQAGKKRTFKNFNMGFIHSQAASSRCSVTDVALK